jgi:hypothetical protein
VTELEDATRRIAERYLGDGSSDVAETDGFASVTTPTGTRRLVRVERRGRLRPSEAYRLYEVTLDADVDPPPAPDGFADVAGELFHLNDPDELRAFWRRIGAGLDPMELAALLAQYQRGADRENLVVDDADARPFLGPEELGAVEGFARPLVDVSAAGFTMEFPTLAIVVEPGRPNGIALRRWTVRADRDGGLDWTVDVLADRLESPFFSP